MCRDYTKNETESLCFRRAEVVRQILLELLLIAQDLPERDYAFLSLSDQYM